MHQSTYVNGQFAVVTILAPVVDLLVDSIMPTRAVKVTFLLNLSVTSVGNRTGPRSTEAEANFCGESFDNQSTLGTRCCAGRLCMEKSVPLTVPEGHLRRAKVEVSVPGSIVLVHDRTTRCIVEDAKSTVRER